MKCSAVQSGQCDAVRCNALPGLQTEQQLKSLHAVVTTIHKITLTTTNINKGQMVQSKHNSSKYEMRKTLCLTMNI